MLTDAVEDAEDYKYIIERQVPSHPCTCPVLASDSLLPPERCPSPIPVVSSRLSSFLTTSVRPCPLSPPRLIFPQICSFCHIANKALHDAIDACSDLPIRFDVEFRPFSILCTSSLDTHKGTSRNAYLAKKFGKEQVEAKCKVAVDMAQKAGLKMYVPMLFTVSPSGKQWRAGRKTASSVGRPKPIDFPSRPTRSADRRCSNSLILSFSRPTLPGVKTSAPKSFSQTPPSRSAL